MLRRKSHGKRNNQCSSRIGISLESNLSSLSTNIAGFQSRELRRFQSDVACYSGSEMNWYAEALRVSIKIRRYLGRQSKSAPSI